MDHLKYNINFKDITNIQAHVSDYNTVKEGEKCTHFFHLFDITKDRMLNTLHTKVNDLSRNNNNEFIELNQVEMLLYREKGLSAHTDGDQLQYNSSIYTYVTGSKSTIRIWINTKEYIDIILNSNTLYGLTYINKGFDINPRNIKHKKIINLNNNYHISTVFRSLKKLQFKEVNNNIKYNK